MEHGNTVLDPSDEHHALNSHPVPVGASSTADTTQEARTGFPVWVYAESKGNTVNQTPTAQQLFGPNPWMTDPAPGFGQFLYSIYYFATAATAALVCEIIELGAALPRGSCKVVEVLDINPQQNQPNQMIQLPDSSISPRNAGLIAQFFDSFPDLNNLNQAMTAELHMPFTFVAPPTRPIVPVVKTTARVELMIASVGGEATQADGTRWKRLS